MANNNLDPACILSASLVKPREELAYVPVLRVEDFKDPVVGFSGQTQDHRSKVSVSPPKSLNRAVWD